MTDEEFAAYEALASKALPDGALYQLVNYAREVRQHVRFLLDCTDFGQVCQERDRLRADLERISPKYVEAVEEIGRLREALQEQTDIISDYRSGRLMSCQEHGCKLQLTEDPVEAERDRLRAEIIAMRPIVEAAREIDTDYLVHARTWFHRRQALSDAIAAYDAALAGGKEG